MKEFLKDSIVVTYHGVELMFYFILAMFWIMLVVLAVMLPFVLMAVGLFAAIDYYFF